MLLTLERRYKADTYTIGRLSVNGVRFCDTLEDRDRGLSQEMSEANIKHLKVMHETAIPTGRYRIDVRTVSPKFKKRWWAAQFGGRVPRLVYVKGYQGVLIHPGNTADDTSGCILVGRNTVKGGLTESAKTWMRLFKMLDAANADGEDLILEIK